MKLTEKSHLEIEELEYRYELLQAVWHAHKELRWASLGEAAELLRIGALKESKSGLVVPGSLSDFTWERHDNMLIANDPFGAEVVVKDGLVSVRTCGGHTLAIAVSPGDPYPEVKFFNIDMRQSEQAWGDLGTGLEGAELAAFRASRLAKAL